MAEINKISSSSNPYQAGSYTAETSEKNTLSIESYFKLLAAQLANQDMSNPMDNSEMLAQMSQMAMVQSLTAMTNSVKDQIAFAQQSYSVGMIGKEVTVTLPGDSETGKAATTKTGIVESVTTSGDEPIIRLRNDTTDYKLSEVTKIAGGN